MISYNKKTLKKIIYNSGDIFLPKQIKDILDKDIIGNSKKTFYISGWTIMHFLSGILFGLIILYYLNFQRFNNANKYLNNYNDKQHKQSLYKYLLYCFILHTLWEIWQIIIGMSRPYAITGNSNIVDILIDTLSFMLGSYLLYNIMF